MKRVSGLAFSILIVLVFLTSCMTLEGRVKSAVSGYPFWYYVSKPYVPENSKVFIGEGKSDNMRQAELFAYSDLSEKLGSYLGYEITQEDYRELVTVGTVSRMGLSVSERNGFNKNGNNTYVILAYADEDGIRLLRTPEVLEKEEKAERLAEIIEQGDEYIKDCEDLKGVSAYLTSMAFSYGLETVEEEYSFESIKEEVIDILKTITIKLEEFDTAKVTATLRLTRKESVISSSIRNCQIRAFFTSVDSMGNSYSDSFTYDSDRNGKVFFETMNNAIVKDGCVTFSLDFEKELGELEKVAPDVASEIRGIIESKTVKFDYNRQYAYGRMGVCVLEYDGKAHFKDSEKFTNYLSQMFRTDSIDCIEFSCNSDMTDEEVLSFVKAQDSTIGCLVILRGGMIDSQYSSTGLFSVSDEGKVVFLAGNGNEIFNSGVFRSNGFGKSFSEAEEGAFEYLCRITYSLIKAYYV